MKRSALKVSLEVLTLISLLSTNIYAEETTGNLFDKKPVAQVASLTAKFKRSASSEKFNGAENEKITYVGDDPQEHMLPADKTPSVRVNKDAPGPFIAMKKAYDEGDLETAHAFADQYVRYMQRVMFEVRELSQMIGEALVRNGIVEEEDWVGASQFIGRELARDKGDKTVSFKATVDVSLERIQPDTDGKAEVYVFCSVSSTYCKEMGPAIERVYRLTKGDASVKFGVFLIGGGQQEFLKDFRTYTGLTMPIQDGTNLARQFRVSFVPAVVVRAPSVNRAYLRTGLIPFPRFYEFVKAVQGQPVMMSDREMNVIATPIGAVEKNPEQFIKRDSETPAIIEASAQNHNSSVTGKIQRF